MDNWDINHTKRYNKIITEIMGVRRVLNLKCSLKLCFYFSEKKKTDVGYDPCQKYRLIWDVLTHNTLCCIKDGGLDLSLDETLWANGSYSDMNGQRLQNIVVLVQQETISSLTIGHQN